MISAFKKLVVGTFFERPVYRISGFFGRAPEAFAREGQLRVERDEANMESIMRDLLRPNSNCIDVGAHGGVFLRRFTELSPGGDHYAFEPLPDFAANLREEFPGAHVFDCALGNRAGRGSFQYVPELPGWSGLRPQPYPVQTTPETLDVEIKRLDDVLPGDLHVTFIKIDVEGGELEVLQGAERIIKRSRPAILFEHARIHNMEYSTTPRMVHDFLVGDCGLAIYSLDGRGPWTRRQFVSIYRASFASHYDRHGETNFLARPLPESRD